jgi:putative protease
VWHISFAKLQTPSGKIFEEIHSGNTHPIVLPATLPAFTFLRLKVKDTA